MPLPYTILQTWCVWHAVALHYSTDMVCVACRCPILFLHPMCQLSSEDKTYYYLCNFGQFGLSTGGEGFYAMSVNHLRMKTKVELRALFCLLDYIRVLFFLLDYIRVLFCLLDYIRVLFFLLDYIRVLFCLLDYIRVLFCLLDYIRSWVVLRIPDILKS